MHIKFIHHILTTLQMGAYLECLILRRENSVSHMCTSEYSSIYHDLNMVTVFHPCMYEYIIILLSETIIFTFLCSVWNFSEELNEWLTDLFIQPHMHSVSSGDHSILSAPMSGDAWQCCANSDVGWHPPDDFRFISVPMFHLLTNFWTICKTVLSNILSLEVFSQNHPLLSFLFFFLKTELNICAILLKIRSWLLAKFEKAGVKKPQTCFTPGKRTPSTHRRLGGPQSWSGHRG
jgi:hypothetical protein